VRGRSARVGAGGGGMPTAAAAASAARARLPRQCFFSSRPPPKKTAAFPQHPTPSTHQLQRGQGRHGRRRGGHGGRLGRGDGLGLCGGGGGVFFFYFWQARNVSVAERREIGGSAARHPWPPPPHTLPTPPPRVSPRTMHRPATARKAARPMVEVAASICVGGVWACGFVFFCWRARGEGGGACEFQARR
jgi:hypothetical protein